MFRNPNSQFGTCMISNFCSQLTFSPIEPRFCKPQHVGVTSKVYPSPVSVAFPSVSLSYAIVAVLGHFLFGEPFGIKQIGGIALIVGGVVLINQS